MRFYPPFLPKILVVCLLLGLLGLPGISQTPQEKVAKFILEQQRLVFQEQGLDPKSYRKEELELLRQQLPEMAELFSEKNLDRLPSEYEDPTFLLLVAQMSKISEIGSQFFKETVDTPIDPPPVIATVPTGLGTPFITWHVPSQKSILFFDAASHTFLLQLANLVAHSLPLAKGNRTLSICSIRPRINENGEITRSFQALLEAYVYDANMRSISPFSTDAAHRAVAIDGLYKPSLFFALAHEYAHAVLGHTADPKKMFPPGRKDFSDTFYKQTNEQQADLSALAIASEAGFREQDALTGAWLFLKGHEILRRALALAATGNEYSFGHVGFPVSEVPIFARCSDDHPLPDVRLTMLEVNARLAFGPQNDEVLCPAYTVDWILEYLWTRARFNIQKRYKNHEAPATHWNATIRCFQNLEP